MANKTLVNKGITISQFLTQEEIEIAAKLKGGAKEICKKVILPNIARINKELGQENDPMYLAYAVEYVLEKMKRALHGR